MEREPAVGTKSGARPAAARRKPMGMSINIGLNGVDPNGYQGWAGPLNGCEADARDMQNIATVRGITDSQLLLTKQATAAAVVTAISKAATRLKTGDFLFVSYSGHG